MRCQGVQTFFSKLRDRAGQVGPVGHVRPAGCPRDRISKKEDKKCKIFTILLAFWNKLV